ncbi:MAG TPA: LacI family DNA-binding transcriptional regulator [Terriglobales bacterium]|nr:LacI family DNA-binding transcriptional regulator [Terriglobales bacterium]
MKTHASIKDIARLARVSVSTVSRVLNHHPDASPEAREKVAKAVELLKYRPNSRARQLAKKTAETICLVLSNREVINAFHARILMGVERYAKARGRNLIFVRMDYSPETAVDELALPAVIMERSAIDGLIVAGTNHLNLIEALRGLEIPFVVFSNNLSARSGVDNLHSVGFDSEDGTRQATEYLLGLHHRNIWCIADISIPWYARCYQGYAEGMRQAGLEPKRVNRAQGNSPFRYGKECAAWLLDQKLPVTAIVGGDDEIALGVLATMRERGIRVPEHLSVVGFDDLEELQYCRPALTTVRVDREKVGEELAKLLFERLETPSMPPVQRLLPTQLVVRETCAPPPPQTTGKSF